MSPCTDLRAQRLLHLYADGELPSARQAGLFAHLAACPACRAEFNALLAFRLVARQEALAVPPAADEAFFARLDRMRRAAHPAPERAAERAAERRLAGGALRRRVPLGAALGAAVLVALLGLLARPEPPPQAEAPTPFRLTEVVTEDGNALYVMDAVTVEGDKSDRRPRRVDG